MYDDVFRDDDTAEDDLSAFLDRLDLRFLDLRGIVAEQRVDRNIDAFTETVAVI